MAKKDMPFNPFDPKSQKKERKEPRKRPTTGRPTSAPRISKAPQAPPSLEPPKPKPAIPTSHLKAEEPGPSSIDSPEEGEGPATASGKARSVGLRTKEVESEGEVPESKTNEDRVSELIAESKALAAESGVIAEQTDSEEPILPKDYEIPEEVLKAAKHVSQVDKAFERKKSAMAKRKKARDSGSAPQKVVKLNRRKYMEFKVDIREILDEEDVAEEHRANILGSAWAKGERQGIDTAIGFVEEKKEEGILSEAASSRIISVLKGYKKAR